MSAGPAFSRRDGLAALALLGPIGLLAACSSDPAPDDPVPSASPPGIADTTVASERELVALYAAVAAAFPELAGPLGVIGAQHQAHAEAIAAVGPGSGEEPADPDAASPTPIAVPGTRARALDLLIASERRALRERIDACVAATEPGLARTLAFIGASEGAHVPALRELRA